MKVCVHFQATLLRPQKGKRRPEDPDLESTSGVRREDLGCSVIYSLTSRPTHRLKKSVCEGEILHTWGCGTLVYSHLVKKNNQYVSKRDMSS